MSLLRFKFQTRLTFRFGLLIGQLGSQIFHTSYFSYKITWREVYRKKTSQFFTESEEPIGKEITIIGSDVTKAAIDCMKRRAQDCNQSGGHLFKNIAIEN